MTRTGAEWARVEPGPCTCHRPAQVHTGWRITDPLGDRRDRVISDYAITTYGRAHIERILSGLPPLPERAWDVLKGDDDDGTRAVQQR